MKLLYFFLLSATDMKLARSCVYDDLGGWERAVLIALTTSSYGFDALLVPNCNCGTKDLR